MAKIRCEVCNRERKEWPQSISTKAWLAVENNILKNGIVFLCGGCLGLLKLVIKLKGKHDRRASRKISR